MSWSMIIVLIKVTIEVMIKLMINIMNNILINAMIKVWCLSHLIILRRQVAKAWHLG